MLHRGSRSIHKEANECGHPPLGSLDFLGDCFLAFRITMVTTCYNRLMISYVSFEDDEHEDGSNMFQRYKDVLIRRQWMEVQCSISQSIFFQGFAVEHRGCNWAVECRPDQDCRQFHSRKMQKCEMFLLPKFARLAN